MLRIYSDSLGDTVYDIIPMRRIFGFNLYSTEKLIFYVENPDIDTTRIKSNIKANILGL